MKASDIVVEMQNGSRVVIRECKWGENKRGEPVLVIIAEKDRKIK